jgi:hypothetical protein
MMEELPENPPGTVRKPKKKQRRRVDTSRRRGRAAWVAATQLKKDHLERLGQEISKPQPPRKALWWRIAGHMPAHDLAALILHYILLFRPEDEEHAPSRQAVALDIGWGLGISDKDTRLQVGLQLLQLAFKAELIRPITRKARIAGKQRSLVLIRLTKEASKRLNEYVKRSAHLDFKEEPKRERPTGDILRIKNRLGMMDPPPLPPAFIKALEHIRGTPWRINELVLNRMLASLDEEELLYVYGEFHDDSWLTEAKRKDRLMAIRTAAKFRGAPFYLDVGCDYRGRIYHHGPLRYTGADSVVQPLLEFANGEEINPLSITVDDGSASAPTLSNAAALLASYVAAKWERKGCTEELVAWTLEHEKQLIEVATAADPGRHPLLAKLIQDTREKEKKKDPSWQALASADAWRLFRKGEAVHLPCSYDAVCSGLQVYALLMRDQELGERVSLTDDSKGKYYLEVANACGISRDAAKAVAVPFLYGSQPKTSAIALAKEDRKPPEMSWQYAPLAEQVREEAKARALAFAQVRDWLTDGIAPVFKTINREIAWITPLGFKVVMDARVMKGREIRVYVEGHAKKEVVNGVERWPRRSQEIKLDLSEPTEELDHEKQALALAANVIHSLDANILVATVNLGAKRGIKNWGVVHDCFAVHPNEIANLTNVVSKFALREVFSNDWLTGLHNQFTAQVREVDAGVHVPAPPAHPRELGSDLYMGETIKA